jgi:Holliday junction resolvase RusA-like endonuclease
MEKEFVIKTKLSANFRHAGKGATSYLSPDYQRFAIATRKEIRELWGNEPSLNCSVQVICIIPHSYRGDLVNYYKGLEDCLVGGGVLKDDNPDIVCSIRIDRYPKNGIKETMLRVIW